MKPRMIDFYMRTARLASTMSRAQKLQVGAVVVKSDNIISFSWNGTPAGWDNDCEVKEYMPADAGGWLDPEEVQEHWPYQEQQLPKEPEVWLRYKLITKPEVIHAERNALDKLARNGIAGQGSTMFVTHAPCLECARSIYGAGIIQVYVDQPYRTDQGMEFLEKCGIDVIMINH